MLFYNARSCYPGPGGLVDSVIDSGSGLQGSYCGYLYVIIYTKNSYMYLSQN